MPANDAVLILMAEDDPDDQLLAREAFEESGPASELRIVPDGQALLDYLRNEGPFSDRRLNPRPALVLMDLNMPRKDGRRALQEIKTDPALRAIPIVVLTTSKAQDDIARSYELGVNSFITKPTKFDSLNEVMRTLRHYWTEVVRLPAETGPSHS